MKFYWPLSSLTLLFVLNTSCGEGNVDVEEPVASPENGANDGVGDAPSSGAGSDASGSEGDDSDGGGGNDGETGDGDDSSDAPPAPMPPEDPLTRTLDQICDEGLGNRGNRIFVEVDRFVVMEAEDAFYDGPDTGNWEVKTEASDYSGRGYYQWFNPANTHGGGFIARSSQLWFNVYISTPGTYIVSVRGRINQGQNDAEHNDVWLRVGGSVADFYSYRSQANEDRYSRPEDIADMDGVGEGLAASRGYLKAYNKTLGRWSYETRNVDFREANIFAVFDEPGLYNVSLAAKVRGFGIDQVVLIGDPAWQTYNRLTNRAAALNETSDRRQHDCD
ncbi:MAG: hypothetical protein AAF654_10550 [Myxococcota bacterium]